MLKSVSSITNAIGALNFKGTWNASTNTPTLASGVGTKGDYFVVSVAGTTTLDGISTWGVGDWATYNGSVWQRVEGGADLEGVNISFTGTASGPTYETSNLASGLTMTDNEIDADGTDTNIDVLINPKGTGGLGVGGNTTGVVAGNTITSKFCVKHEGANQTGGFVHVNDTTAASGAGIFACRSRGTLAAPTIVQNNDTLATISFAGGDGVDLALAARISVEVDGTPGSNDMPGRIVFGTTPDGTQSPVDRMKIDNAGNVTLSTGNLVIGTAGKGIDFSADPSAAGMTSELLDDYEEGTWTATISDGLNNATMGGGGTCQYTKIGRLVTLHGYVYTTSLGLVTGGLIISGLPFTPLAGAGNFTASAVGFGDSLAITAGQSVGIRFTPNSTSATLVLWDAVTGSTTMQDTEWTANGEIMFTATYLVA